MQSSGSADFLQVEDSSDIKFVETWAADLQK